MSPSSSPTQSLADIAGMRRSRPAIIESCPTRIFLPNERAIEPQIADAYERFGLNDRQIEMIGRATPEARLLLPVAPRQPAVRTRPGRGRARLHRRLLQDRPGRHRRHLRRPRPRKASPRRGCAARASTGRPTCSPQPGHIPMITVAFAPASPAPLLCHRTLRRSRPRAMFDRLRPHQLFAERAHRRARAAAGQQRDPEPGESSDLAGQPGPQPREPALFVAGGARSSIGATRQLLTQASTSPTASPPWIGVHADLSHQLWSRHDVS